MKAESNNKIKWLNIRLSKSDYEQISRYFSESSHAAISTYARDILLKKPVVTVVRNQSEDDMMSEVILLKNELKAIGKNVNQAVKKLHALKQVKDMEHWLILFEMDKRTLEKYYESIDANIRKMTEKWLQ